MCGYALAVQFLFIALFVIKNVGWLKEIPKLNQKLYVVRDIYYSNQTYIIWVVLLVR